MSRVDAIRDLKAPLGAAERLWYDTSRWPTFVDGFHHVVSVEGDWPREGSRLVWDSTPAGRGRVTEQVVAYESGEGQSSDVEDPRLRGRQSVRFEPTEEGLRVSLELDYSLTAGGPLGGVMDVLFIRRALRDSLARTLAAFQRELAGDLELLE